MDEEPAEEVLERSVSHSHRRLLTATDVTEVRQSRGFRWGKRERPRVSVAPALSTLAKTLGEGSDFSGLHVQKGLEGIPVRAMASVWRAVGEGSGERLGPASPRARRNPCSAAPGQGETASTTVPVDDASGGGSNPQPARPADSATGGALVEGGLEAQERGHASTSHAESSDCAGRQRLPVSRRSRWQRRPRTPVDPGVASGGASRAEHRRSAPARGR